MPGQQMKDFANMLSRLHKYVASEVSELPVIRGMQAESSQQLGMGTHSAMGAFKALSNLRFYDSGKLS